MQEEDLACDDAYQMSILTSEDAQLQSRIWNRFVKNRPLTDQEKEEVTISASFLSTSLRMKTKVVHAPQNSLLEDSALESVESI